MLRISGLNGDVSYSIADGDIDGQFGINPSNGKIYTVVELDRETAPSYNLIVMATDMANVGTDMTNAAANRRTATAEVIHGTYYSSIIDFPILLKIHCIFNKT